MATRGNLPDTWFAQTHHPLREMARIQQRINRLFDEMIEPVSVGEMFRSEMQGFEFAPPCDVRETGSHYLVSFDIPGISKDEIKIELRDNQLIVSGERKEEHETKEGTRISRERSYGSFQRVLTLPFAAEAAKVEASYENGVLQIAVPKAESEKAKVIPIREEKGGIFAKLLSKDKKTA